MAGRWTTVVDIGEPRFKLNGHGQQGTIVVDCGRLWSTVVGWWLNVGYHGQQWASAAFSVLQSDLRSNWRRLVALTMG